MRDTQPSDLKPAATTRIGSSALLGCDFRDEITQAIIFYNGRGWDWLPLVSYLTAKANGEWPMK
jgi:hypothetical protein